MNELIELWNKHTFKITAVIVAPLLLAFFVSKVQAENIEEIVVYAQAVETTQTDPLTGSTLFSAIMPEKTWIAGGSGASTMFRERGAQSVHTAVYRNGIPANNPGSGWYDFGHDIVSGENVKVISGANGVMYGSGSIAGTVLIQDTIDTSATVRLGSDIHQYVSVAPTSWFQYTDFSVVQEARNDNEEKDKYENKSAKIIADAGDFKVIVHAVDYAYDYDNCYTVTFTQSNDCLQDGEKLSVSVRNEYFTIGRTEEQAEYFTEGVSTYQNDSSRDYFRVGDTTKLSNLLEVTYGVDGSREKYNEHETDNYGAFLSIDAQFALNYNFGFRVGNDDQHAMRLGISKDQFFFNVGTSFRKPNLYEVYGDSYVDANEELLPEEGTGYEAGFGAISIFLYDFEQSIEYTPAFAILDIWTNAKYYNAGSYQTKGVRFSNTFGPLSIMLKVNDTDQARIPRYVTVITFKKTYNDIDFKLKYAGQFDRKPSMYDVVSSEFLDDLTKLNFYATKRFSNNINISFKAENITNEQAEVLPFYSNEGREFYLTIQYNW
tara:strand:+ start:3147 stop:4784 length:1638 start_codon:yes stop_codon:yes gene_type:complete